MPAVVIPIDARAVLRRGAWSLIEIAAPGKAPEPYGILLADEATDQLTLRLREVQEQDLEEDAVEWLGALEEDLLARARETGAAQMVTLMEDSLSNFLRISERTAITYTGRPQEAVDRLFDEHVDREVRPFVTHLPLYHLRAAAGKFGEEMDGEQEGWVRAPKEIRLGEDLFVARVVGRSMEPVITDGSLCVFRAGVTGSRQGRRVLVEELGASDVAARYTVKRYTSRKTTEADGSWKHERVRLEPLNPEYEAFDLSGDEFGTRFRVIAEFVEVLYS